MPSPMELRAMVARSLLIAIVLISFGCSTNKLSAAVNGPILKTKAIDAKIDELVVSGNFNLDLSQDSRSAWMTTASSAATTRLTARVVDHTLYLSSGLSFQLFTESLPTVTLHLPSTLRKIAINGRVNLRGTINNSENLVIYAQGDSKVYLQGMIALSELMATSNAKVELYWVNSEDLNLHINDRATIILAGVAKNVQAKIVNNGKADLKSLRVSELLVKTHDAAYANVTAVGNIAAFAYDNSTIATYKTPYSALYVTRQAGNVLQMGYWP